MFNNKDERAITDIIGLYFIIDYKYYRNDNLLKNCQVFQKMTSSEEMM